jgi:hypothetical protein
MPQIFGIDLDADVGGIVVGSDMAINTLAAVGYRFTHWFSLDAAFRYLYTDYEKGEEGTASYWAYKADQYGVMLGLTFKF